MSRLDPNDDGNFAAGLKEMALELSEEAQMRDILIEAGDPDGLDLDEPTHVQAKAWLDERWAEFGSDGFFFDDPIGMMFGEHLGVRVRTSGWLWQTDSRDIDTIDIVLCTGGPHIEVSYDGRYAELKAFWGGSRAKVPLMGEAIEQACQYWWELAEADMGERVQ